MISGHNVRLEVIDERTESCLFSPIAAVGNVGHPETSNVHPCHRIWIRLDRRSGSELSLAERQCNCLPFQLSRTVERFAALACHSGRDKGPFLLGGSILEGRKPQVARK